MFVDLGDSGFNFVIYSVVIVVLVLVVGNFRQVTSIISQILNAGELVVEPLMNKVYYPASYWTEKGYRPYQEDRYIQLGGIGEEDSSLYAVFDGHGGSRAAQFCKNNLLKTLVSEPSFSHDPAVAMKSAFTKINNEFTRLAKRNSIGDGTTAVVASIHGKRIVVANVGDSRAIIVSRGGRYKAMSHDHKPNREDELRRIRGLGGNVIYHGRWRVQGVLAVSRAIGDVFLHPYVSGEPEFIESVIDENDDYLVIATDGLWDVMSNEQVARFVEGRQDFLNLSKDLCHKALMLGSMDNVTAIVVDLRLKFKSQFTSNRNK